MRLKAALGGNLQRHMEEELRTAELAVTGGVHAGGERLKKGLRNDVIGSGLGRRLAKSWRLNKYPKSGASLEAAAFLFTKSPVLIRAFNEGAKIKSKQGLWLAIPTPSAPKRGVGRKRITPSNFPEHRFGPLRFVYRRNGPSLLVVDNARITKTGRVGRNTVRRKSGEYTRLAGRTTVPMFLLYKQVRLKRRLHVEQVSDAGHRRLGTLIDREFARLDARNRG